MCASLDVQLWSVSGLKSTHSVTSCKFYRAVRNYFSKLASFVDMLRLPLSQCGSWKDWPPGVLSFLGEAAKMCWGRWVPPAGPACTLSPPSLFFSGYTLQSFYHFHNHVSSRSYVPVSKDAAKVFIMFLFSLLQAALIKMTKGQKKGEWIHSLGVESLNLGPSFPTV